MAPQELLARESCNYLFQEDQIVLSHQIGFSQDVIGKAWAELKLADLEAEHQEASQDQPLSRKEFVKNITAQKPLPVIIDLFGQHRLIDSHHKFYSFALFVGVQHNFEVHTRVVKDYSRTNSATGTLWKPQDMIEDMMKNHFLLTHNHQIASLSDLQNLPTSIFDLPDSLERSLMGFVFRNLPTPLKGSDFLPMIQFELAEKMTDLGFHLMDTEAPLSPKHIEKTQQDLLSCKECLKFLKKQLHPELEKKRNRKVLTFLKSSIKKARSSK